MNAKQKKVRMDELNVELRSERERYRRAEFGVIVLFVLFFLISGVSTNLLGFEIGGGITVVGVFVLFVLYRRTRHPHLDRINALKHEMQKLAKS